jgi:ABC-type phosphate transport system substrate-binding protein
MMKIRAAVTTLVALILIPALSMAGDVMLIGNPSVPVSELSTYDVQNIFLGNKITWKDGSEVVFVIQKDSAGHEIFLKRHLNKTPAQFSSYWIKQVFTGKGLAPPSKADDQEVINFVSQTKGAIGYVSTDTGLDKVKIISIK